jgi:peroxiredoxin
MTMRSSAYLSVVAFLLFSLTGSTTASAADIDPDFTLYDSNDELYKLENVRSRAQTELVVVDFFSMFCAPCKEALPKWKKLHQRYDDKGLDIVIVGIPTPGAERGKAIDKLVSYFENKSLPFSVVVDKYSMVAKQYGVVKDGKSQLPQAFVVSSKGKIVKKGSKPEQLEPVIQKKLNTSRNKKED